jgi:predicted acetyltransferase
MASTVTIEVVPLADKPILQQLMEFYLYDFSEVDGKEIGPHGTYAYAYPYLDYYWREPDRFPFFIKLDGRLAGFALVRAAADAPADMAEFFVLRSYRRKGVGSAAAKVIFARYPGEWTVREHPDNTAAQVFWRRVIGEFAGRYEESVGDGEPVTQRFVSGGASA